MTEAFDFNTAPDQREFDVIPKGEIVVVQMRIKPGDAGEDGLLTHSDKGCEGLACELTVVEGKYAKHKLFPWLLLSGTTDGHADMAHTNLGTLKAIIDSALGLKPKDMSEATKKERARFSDLRHFDGIRFMLKVGVEPAKGDYKAKNIIQLVITPGMKEWQAIKQVEQPLAPLDSISAKTDSKAIVKPVWAQ
jgi:hypothetical protein